MGTVFSSLPPESLPSMSSLLIMQTVTASSNQLSLYDNLTKTLQMSSVKTDIMNSFMSITMGTMSSSFVTSDMSSINLPIMSSISASGIFTNVFSQTVQPSSQWSSVLVEISSEIVPAASTSVFLSTAAFSVKSSELILQTMTSSIVVLNSTESELLRTSIMPTSSLFISDSVNISSQLMSSNMSVPVYQQTSQFSAFTSILPSPSSIPILDNMINSSIESVTKSEILLETSSLSVSDGKMLMSSTPILTTRRQTIQTDSVLPVLSSAPEINSTSSVPSTSSSYGTTTPTTTSTTPPPTTTPNLADTYWVKTVIKVPLAENASSTEFLQNLESRLIIAYNRAYERQQQIAAGTFTPLKKRRRKKRLTQVGDTAIDIKESTRSSGNVSLSYTVEKAGTLVPAAEVIRTLGVLSDQEMAIILQYVIASKAETYKKSYDGGTDTTTSSNNLWIIGVALGGIVLLIIIIWIILCVVVKKHRATEKSGGGQGEPHLIGMKSPPGEEGEGEFDGTRVNPKYIKELAERGDNSKYSVQSPKRQTYEVNSEYQEQPEYAQVKKTKKSSPYKRSPKKKQSSDPQQGNSDYETVGGIAEDTELITSPSKSKRSGKHRKRKQPDTFENDEVAAKTYHPVSEVIPHANTVSDTRQYSADIHDDEELRKRKEQERKKNKQRIREKKRKERNQVKKDDDIMKEYLASQQEIDTVLEAPPADGLPDVFKDKSSKRLGTRYPLIKGYMLRTE
ncbi:hypothetical protein KUTeg_001197 [Tegillarca granosa]|uniref:Uncharacterized protein n=1 Tax=Tegillarca granosa TaxID=220873 RepID=A0ABQ9FZX4_TEGGR|nr:hypothetical protein KUTeg_001197 [Tegillarca granosa]